MAHLALYRALRPQTFDQVIGQKHVVYPLQQAVINNTPAHAYLFSGTRGTGKTSIAKIFAKALNCKHPQNGNPCGKCEYCQMIDNNSTLDVKEIDAASNNSVENIRHIVEEINYIPANCRYKVYIIDEAHMLSDSAFNALLKTLEEPPEHAVFILATTEPNRVRSTILSRCQRYDFRLIPSEDMRSYLSDVARQQNYPFTEDGIDTIVRLAQGAMRDALSLLEQVGNAVPHTIDRAAVLSQLGSAQDNRLQDLLRAIVDEDLSTLLATTNELVLSGVDLHRLILDFADFLRNLLVLKVCDSNTDLLNFTDEQLMEFTELSKNYSVHQLTRLITALHKLNNDLRYSGDNRTALEIGLISLIDNKQTVPTPSTTPQVVKPQVVKPQVVKPQLAVSETEIAQPIPPQIETSQPVNPQPEPQQPMTPSFPVEEAEDKTIVKTAPTADLSSNELHKLVETQIKDRFSLICLNNAQFIYQDDKWIVLYDDTQNANLGYYDIIRTRSQLLEQLRDIFHTATGKDGVIEVKLVKSSTEVEDNEPAWIKKIQETRANGFDFPLEIEE